MQNIKRRENYRIAGNFRGRKPSRIGEKCDFRGENFRRLLAFAAPKDATLPNFAEKMKSLGWHIVSEYQVESGIAVSMYKSVENLRSAFEGHFRAWCTNGA